MRALAGSRPRPSRASLRQVQSEHLQIHPLLIDGYNVLTTVEAALAGGVILLCRDGAVRDIASIHGTYRKVEETLPALNLITRLLFDLRVCSCTWLLDSPVSNSGRLQKIMQEVFQSQNAPWQIQIVPNPDPILADSPDIVATADSIILDRCARWFNLAGHALARIDGPHLLDLRDTAQP